MGLVREETYKIALAGLMHDIGKFTGAADMNLPEQTRKNQNYICRPKPDGSGYTHTHAIQTAGFIESEEFCDYLPNFKKPTDGRKEDEWTLANLAACHHNPGSHPSFWLITKADRLSSAERTAVGEDEEEVPPAKYRRTRLLSIAEQLEIREKEGELEERWADTGSYIYPLSALGVKSLFPEKKKELREDTAVAEYKKLFQEFVKVLKTLPAPNENLALWYDAFDSLYCEYTSFIPAARAGKSRPDISLYDHSRVTSALAVALYLYHTETETLTVDAIKDDDIDKFILIKGDFYGIQDFIFAESGESSKFRSKMLRGRSLSVSLFSELAADMICRKIGLPPTSVLLQAGGNFTIIVPNLKLVEDAVTEADREINEWLCRHTYGRSSFGVVSLAVKPTELVAKVNKGEKGLKDVMEKLADLSDIRKKQKFPDEIYGGIVKGYLEAVGENRLCELCGVRPSDPSVKSRDDDVKVCRLCYDHKWLGELSAKKEALKVYEGKGTKGKLQVPIFGEYQLDFSDLSHLSPSLQEGGVGTLPIDKDVLKVWNIALEGNGEKANQYLARRSFSGYIPRYREEDIRNLKERENDAVNDDEDVNKGQPKTLSHLIIENGSDTKSKKGLEALGVLKADIDNLGRLLVEGLPDDYYTFSRIATLSRQIDNFFSIYLKGLFKNDPRFNNIYTIFAGGDDLFLLGPWCAIVELAYLISEKFKEYFCFNPYVSISAGAVVEKPHVPIGRIKDDVERELEASKHFRRDGEAGVPVEKNAFTLFGTTVGWEEVKKLQEIESTLKRWHTDGLINNSFLYALTRILNDAAKAYLAINKKTSCDMGVFKWKSTLSYYVFRNFGKNIKDPNEARDAREDAIAKLSSWLGDSDEDPQSFKIPLWKVLYELRD